ncbi:MAG: hypothetical protein RJA70_1224 [Pseudomonadota bacterium]|jgi:hypothetical protein
MRQWSACLFLSLVLFACEKEKPKEVAPAAPAATPAPKAAAPACPAVFKELANATGEATCSCAQGTVSGPVWGSETYTTDSVICTAARHAGAIGEAGGEVTMKALSGCDAYKGSVKNGVTTSDWGNFGSSFYFVGNGDGKCAKIETSTCPANFKAIPGVNDTTTLSCNCEAAQLTGSLWGTAVYTRDSSICLAAQHAGAIGPTGGKVQVKAAAGCPAYKGTTANGAKSDSWGAYDGSFYVVGFGDGNCEPLPADACPANFAAIPGVSDATLHSCSCVPRQMTGSVWGSGIYTRDSSICQAAVHAGAIKPAGGKVKVKAAAGCASYTGTPKNGVTTSSWPAFGGSFFFVGKGNGKCQ